MTTVPADNERPAPGRLRAGLVFGERLPLVTAALRACPLLELVGQAGAGVGLPGVTLHTDWRVLLAQTNLQAVLLAGSTRLDLEVAAAATQRGLHVWRLPPLARTFSAGAELLDALRRQGTIHQVASWWEHVSDHAWHELQWPEDFKPLYAELRAAGPGPSVKSWRASATEAAGGALADVGCNLLEVLVAVRGLPETVTAAIGAFGNESGAARETEDAALVILRYAGGGTGLVRAAWDLPPDEQWLALHGMAAGVRISPQEVQLLGPDGAIRDRRPLPDDFLAGDLQRFVQRVGGDARDRAAATLERHLAVSAVLESVYLAARTGQPESPRKHYEVQGRAAPKT